MLSFESDYTEGAHPAILNKFIETNTEQQPGYGDDIYSISARKKIAEACGTSAEDIYFITGGTQTNQIVIDTILKPYEGVIAASTGHVAAHEAGAIEYTGHKVLTVPQYLGKLKAKDIKELVETFYHDDNHEHMVFPGMVYISHPTEYGTLYTKEELTEISEVCHAYNLPLFLDGARLGYGLMSYQTDVTLKDIASLTDVFYIGGTKVGALCGEAVVFTKQNTPVHFVNLIKKHGALLAKGRLNGVQFDVLFTDDLYFKISRHAIEMAEKLKKIFIDKGYKFYIDSPTNQQFFIVDNNKLEELKKHVRYGFWEKYDDTHTVVRFATSWCTKEEDVDKLKELL